MPWSAKQHRLFEWAAHKPEAALAAGYHIGQRDAAKMAHEGIATGGLPRRRQFMVRALRGHNFQ